MTDNALQPTPKRRRPWIALLPLVLFLGLASAMGYQLLYGGDPSVVPSALIDKPVPTVEVPPLKIDKPGFGPSDFSQGPVLMNVFASWCVPCRAEHPLITKLALVEKIPVYGLNAKDKRDDALAWLDELGDPYERIGFDPDGRVGIEWGVYGYPETFLVDGNGRIVFKHVGPITQRLIDDEFLPRINALRAGS